MTCYCAKEMRKLYDRHVSLLESKPEFDATKIVHVCPVDLGQMGTVEIVYDDHPLFMRHKSVMTWYLGDLDRFVDYDVILDGIEVAQFDERAKTKE